MPSAFEELMMAQPGYADNGDPSRYDPGTSAITSALMAPFSLPGKALDAIDWVDTGARNTLYRALASLGLASDTSGLPWGENLSGDEFLRRVFGYDTGVGRGERSWAGFGTEVALSPLNLLGIGLPTQAGRAALRFAELAKSAEALRASGAVAKAAEIERVMAAIPAAGRAGRNFVEQGALGQRSALSLDIPFTGIRGVDLLSPLDAIGLGGLRKTANAAALAPLTAAARLAAPIARPLYDQIFRPVGEIASTIPGADTFNRLINTVVAPARRSGEASADVFAGKFRRAIAGVDEDDAARRLADIQRHEDASRPFTGETRPLVSTQGRATAAETLARLVSEQSGMPERLAEQAAEARERGVSLAAKTQGKLDDLLAARNPDKIAAEIELLRDRMAQIGPDDPAVLDVRKRFRDFDKRFRELAKWVPGLELELPSLLKDERASLRARIAGLLRQEEFGPTKAMQRRAESLTKRRDAIIGAADELAGRLEARGKLAEKILELAAPGAKTAEVMGRTLKAGLKHDRMAGVPLAELQDRYQQYLPHVLARDGGLEALEKLRAMRDRGLIKSDSPIAAFVRQYNPERPFTKQRIRAWEGLPATAKNEMVRQATGDASITLFEERPQVAVMQRLLDSGVARGDAMLMRGVIEMFARQGEAGEPVAKFVKDSNLGRVGGVTGITDKHSADDIATLLKGTPLEGATVPYDIAKAALRVNRVMSDEKEWAGLFRVIDGFAQAAKSLYTQIWPQFHVQNAVGDTFNMWLHGFSRPQEFATAVKLLNRISDGTASKAEIAMFRRAVSAAPVTHTADREAIKLLGKNRGLIGQVKPLDKAVRYMSGWGNYGENVRKVAMFLDGKAKGLTDLEAGRRVEQALFDYDKLSGFEKEYGRRIFLFYTFTRKAAPMLLSKIFENPRAMRIYASATGKIGGGDDGLAQDSLPAWLRRASPVSWGVKDAAGRDMFSMLNLPPDTLFQFADHPLSAAMANLSVLPRAIGELGSGVNFATGRPLSPPSKTAQAILGPEMTKQLGPLLRIEPYTPLARLTGTVSRLGRAISGEESGRTVLDQLLTIAGFPSTYRNDASDGVRLRDLQARRDVLERLYDAGRASKVYDYRTDDEAAKAVMRQIGKAQAERRKEMAR